jgi:hypothetical protein
MDLLAELHNAGIVREVVHLVIRLQRGLSKLPFGLRMDKVGVNIRTLYGRVGEKMGLASLRLLS